MTYPHSASRVTEQPLLNAVEITKTFHHGGRILEVLRGITLTIQAKEMISIVGMSGAGKSTFLHILGTLDRPTSGNLYFEGTDLSTLTSIELASFRNRTIGFVFQFHHLLPEFTALENTMMPALIFRMDRREARERAEEMLSAVGLSERLDHKPSELSGGEQQRVALARALLMRPRLLLTDEPTGNLDRQTGLTIHDLLIDLNRSFGIAMVVVTHNADLANRMPRRLQMIDGQLFDADLVPAETRRVEGVFRDAV